jgi:hypothetical protein
MHIWRDIPSQDEIRDGLSRQAQRDGAIIRILAIVARYHVVQKDLADNILPRYFVLQEIATAIDKRIGSGTKLAVKTALHFAAHLSEPDTAKLRSLAKRARAKAEYLDLLKGHYRQNKDELVNAKGFWEMVHRPRDEVGKQIGLVTGVLLEKADPLHRDFEGPGPSEQAEGWWSAISEGRTTAPLWLHLETTSFSLDKSVAKSVDFVPYVKGKADAKTARVFSIVQSGRLRQAVMDGTPDRWEWSNFDTSWIVRGFSGKGHTSAEFGKGECLAYVWTGKKELFASLHNPEEKAQQPNSSFHHSSFTSGDMVLCAGMIAASEGFITFLSNDSGHYRPGTKHLAKMVRFVHKRGLFHRTAVIIDMQSPGQLDTPFTVTEFLARQA